jgi:hypothetical protein
MRTSIGVVVVVAVAIAVAGCGSGSDDAGGLTRAQLDVRTSRICTHGTAQVNRLGTPDLNDPAAATTWLESVLRVADGEVSQARGLEPAAGLKPAYDAWIAQVVAERDFVRGVLAKARARDRTGLQDLQDEAEHHTHDRALAAAARRAGLTGCAKDAMPAGDAHMMRVTYEPPQSRDEQLSAQILKGAATQGIADAVTKGFELPADVTIAVRRGSEPPSYDPATHTITWTYGFVAQIATVLKQTHAATGAQDLGTQLASIVSFFTLHEIGHAFIDLYQLPTDGREEDAADGLATVLLTRAVSQGAEYVFYAARFMRLIQHGQGADIARFHDEHSLSIRRSDNILCAIAGASPENMRHVASTGALSRERLARCPAEYRSKVQTWKALLGPHLRR